jgi:predicted GH43/DUF377 family glycosyl hydrolase
VTKSACILPEKINGKYVIFHRVFPDILIDYRDDLDFEDGQYLSYQKRLVLVQHCGGIVVKLALVLRH